jgi:hypothetical protein
VPHFSHESLMENGFHQEVRKLHVLFIDKKKKMVYTCPYPIERKGGGGNEKSIW